MATPDRLTARLADLPAVPGVYLFLDVSGSVVYVGKAKSLRSRVRSYFREEARRDPRRSRMSEVIEDVETILVESEAEALLLEANLIREHSPRFNVQLKDDKSFPYVKVTVQEAFPRVLVTRSLERDGSRYFGPFTNVKAMRRALRAIKTTFTVRSCDYPLPRQAPDRPCLDFHIDRCKAPCVGYQSEEDYRVMIDQILEILGGRSSDLRSRIRQQMEEASEDLAFEEAAELRDVLAGLDVLRRRPTTIDYRGGNRDILGVSPAGEHVCVVLLRVRDGHLLGKEARLMRTPDGASLQELVGAALRGFYIPVGDVPEEILVPAIPEDHEVLESILTGRRGGAVEVARPQRGQKRRLVELAGENARHVAADGRIEAVFDAQADSVPDAAERLARALELAVPPRSLACFDVSTLGGRESVGSAVWLTDGRPDRSQYRRFRIRNTVDGDVDDYAMMQEVVGRYFHRRVAEEASLPDLVVIDGGKGQLSAALQGMESAGVSDLPVVALAKRLEEVYRPGHATPVRLPATDPGLRWLQTVRDEAHRFAVGYNRRLRRSRTLKSELSRVPGVGPKRERDLLRRFGSVAAIRRLTVEDLSVVPGIGRATATRILDELSAQGQV
jgi:excinuclease ABC subunit C